LNSFGSPTTQSAPSTAPATDDRPPMTTIEMTRSDSAAGKSPGCARVSSPTNKPPARPAIHPPMPNAVIFTAPGEMPSDAAARSLSRTAIIERPRRLRCKSATARRTTPSAMRQIT